MNSEYKVTVRQNDLVVEDISPLVDANINMLLPIRIILFFVSFVLTIIVETIVAVIFLKASKIKLKIILWVLLANLISVPIVWFAIPAFKIGVLPLLFVSEAFAFVFESLFIYQFNKKVISLRSAFLLGLFINAASFVLGFFLMLLGFLMI